MVLVLILTLYAAATLALRDWTRVFVTNGKQGKNNTPSYISVIIVLCGVYLRRKGLLVSYARQTQNNAIDPHT
ncbi:hypothetical protein [Singapore grouper iridovirus]|nr:hypothetical protein [Singapore grouper iridovirus]